MIAVDPWYILGWLLLVGVAAGGAYVAATFALALVGESWNVFGRWVYNRRLRRRLARDVERSRDVKPAAGQTWWWLEPHHVDGRWEQPCEWQVRRVEDGVVYVSGDAGYGRRWNVKDEPVKMHDFCAIRQNLPMGLKARP